MHGDRVNQKKKSRLTMDDSNFGLLRFRSTPSSVRANFRQGEEGGGGSNNGNNHTWEGFEPETERLVLRFMNSGENNHTDSPTLQEFVDHKPSSKQGYSASGETSSMLVGNSVGMDYPKSFINNPHLLRQSSSPASHFSNIISFQNGTVLVCTVFVE